MILFAICSMKVQCTFIVLLWSSSCGEARKWIDQPTAQIWNRLLKDNISKWSYDYVNYIYILYKWPGPDSWFIFHALQLDCKVIIHDVANASHDNLSTLNVVNDFAERGVKLSLDFLANSNGEEQYQNVLQVVQQDRHWQFNFCKQKKEGSSMIRHMQYMMLHYKTWRLIYAIYDGSL